jgi:anti-sigma regulatory factor (Ser/Thr protein kinase)
MNLCDELDRLRVGTALGEALVNAIDHGNLELDSNLRQQHHGIRYRQLAGERCRQPPYSQRRVHVTARFTPSEATFVIRDEGPGFDPAALPDPTDPENLLKPSGRGVMLIKTFMDDVRFNTRGNEITMVKRRSTEAGAPPQHDPCPQPVNRD